MQPSHTPLAFFDLDRTLVAENTGRLWVEHERREGIISSLQAARAMVWLGLYHLSLIDLDRAYSQALAHYRGVADSALRARTEAWFQAAVAHRLQPGARAALDWHRAQGHRCVMLTNSSPYQAAVATRTWGLDGWVSNHFIADSAGLLTGEIERPICYGAGKTTRAERWAAEHGGSVAESWFYTDSLSDLPMLEAVARPRIVQPDPRLRRVAARRGWPILDWRSADGAVALADR
jgi:HAD superfamily hydrolase (TIGR01490 family)